MTDGIERLIVNSDSSLVDCDNKLLAMYNEHKHLTVTVKPGIDRTVAQNSLQRKWLGEAENQGDMTAEEYRGYCKLHFGVVILLNENESFREVYDRVIRGLAYEQKIELMMVPMDLPVTRIMTRKQKTKYLDKMYQHFAGLGFQLTRPDNEN